MKFCGEFDKAFLPKIHRLSWGYMSNKHLRGVNMSSIIRRLPHVKERTGLGRSSIYSFMKAGSFPRPVSLGARSVGWLESDITEWIESRPLAPRVSQAVATDAADLKGAA